MTNKYMHTIKPSDVYEGKTRIEQLLVKHNMHIVAFQPAAVGDQYIPYGASFIGKALGPHHACQPTFIVELNSSELEWWS